MVGEYLVQKGGGVVQKGGGVVQKGDGKVTKLWCIISSQTQQNARGISSGAPDPPKREVNLKF